MRNDPIYFSIVLTFFLLHSAVALATVRYVAPTGVDPSDCTGGTSWESAFATIQKAIDCSQIGDEIWVQEGTYVLSQQIVLNKLVYIYGGFLGNERSRADRDWLAHNTIIDGNNRVRGFYITSNAKIDGFIIQNGVSGHYYYGGGGIFTYREAAPIIRHCILRANSNAAIQNYGSFAVIEDCIIYGNDGGGISNYHAPGVSINACIIYDNRDAGIANGDSIVTILNTIFYKNEIGINSFYTTSQVKIKNCTIFNNIIGIRNNDANPYIINSIIYNNEINIEQPAVISFSDVQGGYSGVGNIDADPMFIDPEGGDFHLLPGSPCIDAGINTVSGGLPATDFEGDPRILDGDGDTSAIVDMGADEYVPPPTWRDITSRIAHHRSRTLFDRVNRVFFVLVDITNNSGEDLTGPVRMVLFNNTLELASDGPGIDPDGYTDGGNPYFIIVPDGSIWEAGSILENIRLDFVLRRAYLDLDLRFDILK